MLIDASHEPQPMNHIIELDNGEHKTAYASIDFEMWLQTWPAFSASLELSSLAIMQPKREAIADLFSTQRSPSSTQASRHPALNLKQT